MSFTIGNLYSFNTKAPAILGARIANARLEAVLDYNLARSYDNIDLKYRQIYPVLPAGTPDNVRTCQYYVFKSESGQRIVMADQWIDATTLQEVTDVTIYVEVRKCSIEDVTRVRDALHSLGMADFTIDTKQ